ncbi:hypothetical protein V500_11041 [Pseudogymnoascus sp. VKM F-4518 (FW-2643)]|nr:hypothetical protein V500_11041 [Pseudogymnoascus sp. VKM F-4518 (FW-2643)]
MAPSMISLPPAACCTKGTKHEGITTGTIEKIGDIDAYFARPTNNSSEKAIIIFGDIFGIYQNSKLVADSFAARGFLTVVPDLLDGDSLSTDDFDNKKIDLPAWLPKHLPDAVDPIVEKVIKHLRETLKVKKIAGVGYCYGARYVVRNLKGEGLLDSGYLAHPSFVTTEEFSAITKPVSIAASEIDNIFTRENRYEAEKILVDLNVPYQINVYGSVDHGFALRADMSVKKNLYAMEDAFKQAVAWFENWL